MSLDGIPILLTYLKRIYIIHRSLYNIIYSLIHLFIGSAFFILVQEKCRKIAVTVTITTQGILTNHIQEPMSIGFDHLQFSPMQIQAERERVVRFKLTSSEWKSDTLIPVLYPQIKYAYFHKPAYLSKSFAFSRYCCEYGRIRTYSTRRYEIYSLAQLSNSGAYPYNNGINKTQTQLRSLNVSGYKDTAFSGLCKQINVKICNSVKFYLAFVTNKN